MAELEKVIKGFECCHIMVHDLGADNTACGICPYKNVQTEEQIELGGIECIAVLHDDAMELIKELVSVKPLLSVTGWVCGHCGHLIAKNNEKLPEKCNVCGSLVGGLV